MQCHGVYWYCSVGKEQCNEVKNRDKNSREMETSSLWRLYEILAIRLDVVVVVVVLLLLLLLLLLLSCCCCFCC